MRRRGPFGIIITGYGSSDGHYYHLGRDAEKVRGDSLLLARADARASRRIPTFLGRFGQPEVVGEEEAIALQRTIAQAVQETAPPTVSDIAAQQEAKTTDVPVVGPVGPTPQPQPQPQPQPTPKLTSSSGGLGPLLLLGGAILLLLRR